MIIRKTENILFKFLGSSFFINDNVRVCNNLSIYSGKNGYLGNDKELTPHIGKIVEIIDVDLHPLNKSSNLYPLVYKIKISSSKQLWIWSWNVCKINK